MKAGARTGRCRHRAYSQTRIGYKVKRVMPGRKGQEVERLDAHGKDRLAGKPINHL